MQTVQEQGRTTLSQSRRDILVGPAFVLVCVLAVVIREFIPPPASPVALAICGGVVLLDIFFAGYVQRNGLATMIVTHDLITLERAGNTLNNTPVRTMQHAPNSALTFKTVSNGFIGGQFSYMLKLRDTATGTEMPVNAFGRRPVRQACESQGWKFSGS
jgi:hypothetical protein